MKNEEFLERLSEYVERGILQLETFEEIKEKIFNENKEEVFPLKNDGFSSKSKPISFFN